MVVRTYILFLNVLKKTTLVKSMKRYIKVTIGHFLHPEYRKKWLWWSRLCDVLSRRMARRTHNLPSGHLNKRLWWIRWRVVSMIRKAKRTYFPYGYNQLGRSRFNDALSRLIRCLLNVLKCDLVISNKRWFMMLKGHSNTFTTFWALKKAIWTN
jgi:hypothetical protein